MASAADASGARKGACTVELVSNCMVHALLAAQERLSKRRNAQEMSSASGASARKESRNK
eukprot:14633693-Alexandrium_andersonii.AAC.1